MSKEVSTLLGGLFISASVAVAVKAGNYWFAAFVLTSILFYGLVAINENIRRS